MTSPKKIVKVNFESKLIWSITVKRARILTTDSVEDVLFFAVSPSPSVRLSIATQPELKYYETSPQSAWFPEWHETKRFVLDHEVPHTLAISLMNNGQELGKTRLVKLTDFVMNKLEARTLTFDKYGEVDLLFFVSQDPKLRHSTELCETEKEFTAPRLKFIHDHLPKLLAVDKEKLYKHTKEVPRIAIVASGGGLRAMAAFAGVLKALQSTGLLDSVAHISASGGSAWLLSRLYSDPTFPHRSSVAAVTDDLLKRIENAKLENMLSVQNLRRYIKVLQRRQTQKLPITLTDLLGVMVGDHLYGDRMHALITDQKGKLDSGKLPLPIYSAVSVTHDKAVKEHYDWMEITPFETGSESLSSWIPTDVFGAKFSNGRIAKGYGQVPLYWLLGVWGSKITMQWRAIGDENQRADFEEFQQKLKTYESKQSELPLLRFATEKPVVYGLVDEAKGLQNGENNEAAEFVMDVFGKFGRAFGGVFGVKVNWALKDYLDVLESELGPNDRQTCEAMQGACGVAHSFLRGGKVAAEDGSHEADAASTLLLAESGLALELPLPPVCRSARKADIILSFDFSTRPSEEDSLFASLHAAHEWATASGVAFPPIGAEHAQTNAGSGMYVFKDQENKECPTVIHFPLMNSTKSREKIKNFKIFGNQNGELPSNNFNYDRTNFGKLVDLMEINVQSNAAEIKRHIAAWFERS